MPLHSIQRLSPTTLLGLWHLAEPPEALWPLLPPGYRALIPPTAGLTRQAHWLGVRALAHALAAQLLPAATQLLIRNDADGRPQPDGVRQPLSISLSHSGEWAAAIISTSGAVGIDIEIIRNKARRLATMFLSEEEMMTAAALPEASATQRYSLLWSAKETLYKLAARPGLIFAEQLLLDVAAVQAPLPEVSAAPLQLPATLRVSGADIRHCICYSEPAPGYVLTYCHPAAAAAPAVS